MGKLSNAEIIRKATITTEHFASGDGKLPPQHANEFIDEIIDQTAFQGNIRIERMKPGETWEVHKMGLNRRASMPAREAKDPGVRRSVSPSKIAITPVEIVTPFEVADAVKRVNLIGDNFEKYVIGLMSRQSGNDYEELLLGGNVLGPAILESDWQEGGDPLRYRSDTYLGLFNGLLTTAEAGGNLVDAANGAIGASLFSRLIRQMPVKYRRNRKDLRYWGPSDIWELWRERVSTRATPSGDAALGGGGLPKPLGIEPIDLPLMPFNPRIVERVQLNGTTAVQLQNAPISNVVVMPDGTTMVPTDAYIDATDYNMDLTLGTIARDGAGAITNGQFVLVTYEAQPQVVLTHRDNLILVVSEDVKIEKARDIYRGVDQFVIRTTIGFGVENDEAMAKLKNISTTI